ncbi:MAG: chloride channel protein [Candidatus Binatus sp.]|uniref:chloride channel protein n=1 Tax=Candidatus Binatus sp. TaxID=2811406 RepID=UPI003BAE6292
MRRPTLSLRVDQFEYVQLILLAVIVGVLAALGNLGFRQLIELFSWVFRELEWQALGIEKGGFHRALIPLVLLSGGVAILVLDRIFPEDVLGYGFPNFLEMVNLGTARLKRRWIFVKAAGAALSLGSGASVGREGPIAQVGGAIGSTIAQLRKLSPDRAKVLVAAGAGAGIATTFNAPIGGLMFAQEIILLGHTEIANLTLLIIATFTAVITSRAIIGNAVVFTVPEFVLRSYWEMATYALMGAALGALAAGYIRFFNATEAWFRRLNLPVWVKLEAGLAVVGVIAIWLPENLSDGYPVINRAMAGEFGIGMLAALTCAKIFASSVSLGCGAPGGSFGPTFFIGTMAGGFFQRVSAMAIPHLTGPRGSYALVGLGAFLAGTTHAPLTALFLLWEMTHSDTIALPAMIATITALVVARAIETESIDEFRLAREGKTLQIGRERLALALIPVSAVVTKNVTIVNENTSLAEVLRTAGETAQSTLPVLNSDGELAGTIVVRDLLTVIGGGQELGPLVNAFDICNVHGPTVTLDANLDEASQLMEHDGLDEIPVVERVSRRFLGLVTSRQIAQALNRVSVSLSTLATRDTNIYWATGYRVTRIGVPANAAGKTLRQLDPRARFSITVLAVQDANNPDSGFAPIAPDRPLKPGDELVVAGRSQDIRQFTHELESIQPAEAARASAQSSGSGKT